MDASDESELIELLRTIAGHLDDISDSMALVAQSIARPSEFVRSIPDSLDDLVKVLDAIMERMP